MMSDHRVILPPCPCASVAIPWLENSIRKNFTLNGTERLRRNQEEESNGTELTEGGQPGHRGIFME